MESKVALTRIREAADVLAMIEDLTNPSRSDSLTSASWSGMRATLKQVREQLIESHRTLTGKVTVTSSPVVASKKQVIEGMQENGAAINGRSGSLKSSLEKYIE